MSGDRISGNIIDVLNSVTYPGTLEITDGRITDIMRDEGEYDTFIIPGLIDAHIHIESSMLIPSEFARLAVTHGTVACVSDPHEIGNVLGAKGVSYMIENGEKIPFKFYFGAPSCVPATRFETSGAEIGVKEVDWLLKNKDIWFLSEVMNYPGVINDDPTVMTKIGLAKRYGKPVDGHAPGLKGKDLEKYIKAGISTDHESFGKEEALEKLRLGMKILIREGSAAKNFDTLSCLIEDYPDMCMLCSDDKHPDELVRGHINELVKKALKEGIDEMKVLKCACINPVLHYGLDVGLLQKNDYADFIVIDNFREFNILKTYINGELVSENRRTLLPKVQEGTINRFNVGRKRVTDFSVKKTREKINVIEAIDGQVITGRFQTNPRIIDGYVVSDPMRDILKITVVNRYLDTPPTVGFVKNFGLKKGAIASSVAHDSHNVVAVGVRDEDLCRAVNRVIENKGGLAVVSGETEASLSLPVAGIMTNKDAYKTAREYVEIQRMAKGLGTKLKAPFMTLSFMTLLVIPKLKLGDKGLFDGEKFEIIAL
jgi:adenine deaminase